MNDDLEIQSGADFNMDDIDDMPQFVSELDGVYVCSLSLKRDTEPKNDKEVDNIIFNFTIDEIVEERKNYGVTVGDMVYIRNSLLKTKRDIDEKRKDSFGLRMVKPYLVALKESLGCEGSLNTIINEAQDVKVTATFTTRTTKGTSKDGEPVEYKNINIKKLIVS